MSTFDSTKTQLGKLLEDVVEGRIQLPDFQRGWVWDDGHIRSLLVSIARSFPIGAVMLLETGGEARFQVRAVEGVDLPGRQRAGLAELLILDGQQRLTSLTQVLRSKKPVATRDEKKREIRVHYYFDIETTLCVGPMRSRRQSSSSTNDERSGATSVAESTLTSRRRSVEVASFHFPCDQILDSSAWEYALMTHDRDKFPRFLEFRKRVLDSFRNYMLPVIALKKQTSKEKPSASCSRR